MAQAKHLFELQQTDTGLDTSRAALQKVERELSEARAVASARAEIAAAESNLETLTSEHRSLEKEAEGLGERIASESDRLYGGKVKSPKELGAIEQEVKALGEKKRAQEDRLLELMGLIDGAQEAVKQKKGLLRQVEATWKEEKKWLQDEKAEIEDRLSFLEERRQTLAGAIGEDQMRLYSTLRQSKGQAVVRIDLGRCQGCRLTLSVAELQQARTGKIMQCHSCGRILYLG